jgi:hypothetical protein
LKFSGRHKGRLDPASYANRRGRHQADERLRQVPHLSLAQHADEPVAISTRRTCIHLRENAVGNLEMAVSLASLHFQLVGWK